MLLVRHTYGPRNWELPGGGSEDGEDLRTTARREFREETGVDVDVGRLTGLYLEPAHPDGPFVHGVFRLDWSPDDGVPVPASPEVDAAEFWPVDALPRPLSSFTEQRILDARSGVIVDRVIASRGWLPATR